MSGYYLIFLGIVLILTPVLIIFRDGAREDADFLLWMMSQPLSFIIQLQLMIIAGFWLVRSGVLMINLIG